MHFDTSPNQSKFVKFGICAPGPQSAPRGTETATFGKGFFQSSNLRKMLTCFTKSLIKFSSNCVSLSKTLECPQTYSDKGIPTGVFPQGVFRQRYSDRGYSNKVFRQRYCDRGYSNRRYSDMGYFDRVYLLRAFPRVVPSAHTSPLLLKGGINLGVPNTTRMRANTPWARKRYHKRKAICGLQALLY